MKNFRDHFYMLMNKFSSDENFAFTRFSDGELRIMQGKKLVLASDHYQIGDQKIKGAYHPEDRKNVDPTKHQHIKDKLIEAYQHLQENYFVGLSCRCCVGESDFNQMLNWYKGDVNSDLLTWSNLWVNGNYTLFREHMLPLFKNKKIVYIVNKDANLSGLPFEIVKDYRIGENCIINNFGLENIIGEWIENESIENHTFLFSASSLSNMVIYELYKKYPNNTYIDIGTTLNRELGMKGMRGYLSGGDQKICIW